MERVKPIIIHTPERDYTLEFNRDTIKFAEQRGFMMEDVPRFPMTKVPELIWYALRMHHPNVSLKQAENLLDRIGGMSEQMGSRLGELWSVPFDAIAADEDGEPKNTGVTVEL